MKILALALLGVVAQASAAGVDLSAHEWLGFKLTHNKMYNNVNEELKRMQIYHENKRAIEEHNELYNKGLVSYNLKMNQYGDLHQHEFRSLFNRLNVSDVSHALKGASRYVPSVKAVPDSIDWRQQLAVTKVKNQGSCGSCWSFSTTGSLEGQWKLKKGTLVSLSEQNLVDCSSDEGNDGCNGGLMTSAFTYIQKNGGIDSESSYPYEGVQGQCRFNKDNVAATVTGFSVVDATEDALKQAVGTVGPISVAMDASGITFQFYFSGIYDPWFCSSEDLDHGVLAVGYGHQDGKDFWLVKNSWGASWGDAGYFKIVRNSNNKCGLASMACYPLVE